MKASKFLLYPLVASAAMVLVCCIGVAAQPNTAAAELFTYSTEIRLSPEAEPGVVRAPEKLTDIPRRVLDAPSAGSTTVEGELDLDQAVRLALVNSPYVRIAAQQYRRATGNLREARGALKPSFAVSGTYIRYDEVAEAEVAPGQTIKLGESDQKQATATISVPIDVSGFIGAAVDAARYREVAAGLDYAATQQFVLLSVRQAYLDALRARDAQAVAGESVDRLRVQLRLANVRFQAGASPRFDVIRAETDLAAAEQNLIASENQAQLAKLRLANVLGVRFAQSVELKSLKVAFDPPIPALDVSLDRALQARPELIAARANLLAAERGIAFERRGLLPTLQLQLNYRYNGNTTLFQPREFTADAVVAVNIPIFDGGVTAGRVQAAEAQKTIAREALTQQEQEISFEVEQAYVSIENARKQVTVAQAALAQAAEGLRLAQVRYESGVGLLIEVTDAEVANTQAQNNLVNAQYDLYLAYASLARAIGNPELGLG